MGGRAPAMHEMQQLDHLQAAHGDYFRHMSRGPMSCLSPRSGAPPALTPPSLAVGSDLLSSHPNTPVSARRPLGLGQLQPSAQPFPNLWQPQQLTPPLNCGVRESKPGPGHLRQLSPPRNILENLPGLPNLLEYRHPMSMH